MSPLSNEWADCVRQMGPAIQQDQVCSVCGWSNDLQAVYCAGCGAPLASADESTANAVAGAPVRQGPRPASESLREAAESVVVAVRDSMGPAVRESVGRAAGQSVVQNVRQSVIQSVNQLTETIEDPQRKEEVRRQLARIGLAPPPPLPVPLPPSVPLQRRLIYFLLVGSWLSVLWVLGTWVSMLTIVGRPLALRMIDAAPHVLTLRPLAGSSTSTTIQRWQRQATRRATLHHSQYSPALRIAYFLLVGCWASLLWLIAAYVITLTAGESRTGEAMFDITPTVAYLERL